MQHDAFLITFYDLRKSARRNASPRTPTGEVSQFRHPLYSVRTSRFFIFKSASTLTPLLSACCAGTHQEPSVRGCARLPLPSCIAIKSTQRGGGRACFVIAAERRPPTTLFWVFNFVRVLRQGERMKENDKSPRVRVSVLLSVPLALRSELCHVRWEKRVRRLSTLSQKPKPKLVCLCRCLLSSTFLTLYSHFVLAEQYGVHHAHFQEGHQQVEPGTLYVYTCQYAFQRV